MTAAHTNQETWQTALQWVESNRPLIRRIAAPYLRHMAADSDDLLQEAALAAFQALRAVRRKQAPEQFTCYFRVIFKTHCLKLASGIQTDPAGKADTVVSYSQVVDIIDPVQVHQHPAIGVVGAGLPFGKGPEKLLDT
jgi:DNA-directed RNA polymerase specialized sigma24 family protein